jgi:anti-sigma factor RsiW
MKKECEETRKALPKYLRGLVFRAARGRIERHLGQCVICRSEFETLRRSEETLQILRDINASGGVVGRVKDGVTALGKIKKLFYRPLWIAGIALAAAAAVYYLMTPRQLEIEIDRIVQSTPSVSAPAAPPGALSAPASASTSSAAAGQSPPASSDLRPKTTHPRPAKSPSAPPREKQLPKKPAETAAPAPPAPEPSQPPPGPQ